jgi:hypothetical protein
MIKVDAATHARLAELAAENGMTIGGYVAHLVGAKRTRAEWETIAAQTEEYLRDHFGFVATPEERAKAEAWFTAPPPGAKRKPRASA